MLTPAQKHFQSVMAQRTGLNSGEETGRAYCTRADPAPPSPRAVTVKRSVPWRQKRRLKELLPDFAGWIDGTLEGDSGRRDEVITTLMVWAVDCGDLALALRIGEYVIRHNLSLPDNFGRDATTVLTEEICNPILTLAGTDPDADLSGFIAPLDTLWEMVANRDMPDEVLAKLCKACAFARRASTDPETQGASLKLLRRAMHLNPNAGVKREIAALTRALKRFRVPVVMWPLLPKVTLLQKERACED